MDAISKIQSLQFELNRFSPVRQQQATAVQPRPEQEPVKTDASPKDDAARSEVKERDRAVTGSLEVTA